MRALIGTSMYGTDVAGGTDGIALVTGASQDNPTGDREYVVVLLDHSDDIQANHPELWGNDYLAGGAGDDMIFGELGNDVIQGDGAVDGLRARATTRRRTRDAKFSDLPALLADGPAGTRIGAWRNPARAPARRARTRSATRSARSSSTRPSRRTTDGERLHRGQRRQRHDLRRPRPGRHRRRQLRPLRPRRPVRHAQQPDADLEGHGHLARDGRPTILTLAGTGAAPANGTLKITIPATGESFTRQRHRHRRRGRDHDHAFRRRPTTGIPGTVKNFDWAHAGFYAGAGTSHRPAGSDLIFGGAGTEIARNDIGKATIGADNTIIVSDGGHALDSDAIAGDNADIFRIVGTNGSQSTPRTYMSFLYDNYAGGLRIIPRAVQLLDYTQGGPAYNAASAALDRGAADEIHGESGDDFIYAMTGNDVVFGEGQDDDIVGGYGNDWISAGTGDDGVVGDDGRISTSRNSTRLHVGRLDRRVPADLHRQRRRDVLLRAAVRHPGAAQGRPRHAHVERQRPRRVHLLTGSGADGDDQRRPAR